MGKPIHGSSQDIIELTWEAVFPNSFLILLSYYSND